MIWWADTHTQRRRVLWAVTNRQQRPFSACLCQSSQALHDNPPDQPMLAGLTVAEHFRDAEGQDVLLFVDNIFRFTQVGTACQDVFGQICPATAVL